ncbi:unnamed protein product [Brachionus calyciflorus]|uniref:Reverse transcriptase RNase H-like domain-containing protein n=1 Tax=Brachionus calyciflorus TaxID=104777 RepID=A0A814LLK0_9BILA|nr:unnamed protein product [Brachionus calyciflorus]
MADDILVFGLSDEEHFDHLSIVLSLLESRGVVLVLTVDASPVGLGAILSQINPKNQSDRRGVAFASRRLTETESRYSQCEKEGLICVSGCEKFWTQLFGHTLDLETDNRAIQLILNKPNS